MPSKKIHHSIYEQFWFKDVPSFFTTKTLRVLSISCIVVGVYTWAVIYFEFQILHIDFKPSSTLFSFLGLVLGLLLVFRTNTAYDRWWEGRRLLGSLLNDSRSLALKLDAYLPETAMEDRTYLAEQISNFGFALKEHLRFGVKFEELQLDAETESALKKSIHVPNAISGLIYKRINKLYKSGIISEEQFIVIDKQIVALTDILGSCERIKSSPIPASYSTHLKMFMFFYVCILPFGIMHDMRFWSVPIMVMVFYAFVGLEIIGEEIEDPFGHDPNDLPTDAISVKIKNNVDEILLKS